MRSIPITFLATISLSAILAIAASAHVQAEEPAKPETAASQSDAESLTQPSGDYYSRRAEKILEKAAAGDDNKPHPLAKTYPEDFVIVCEAGCRERRAAIVSREPREAVKVVEGGRLITLSADGESTSGTPENILVCLAGCRPGSVVIPSAPPQISEPYVPVSRMTHPAVDEFKTTVGPESGRWLSGAGADDTKTN